MFQIDVINKLHIVSAQHQDLINNNPRVTAILLPTGYHEKKRWGQQREQKLM